MKPLSGPLLFFRRNLITAIGLCLCAYFAWHTLAGERSYPRFLTLKSDNEILAKEHEALVSERTALESDVKKLRPGSIDPDMLEERARHMLGHAHADEVTVLEAE